MKQNMQLLNLVGLTVRAKSFKTGSVGYFAFGQTRVGNDRVSVSLNVVKVHSKGESLKPEPDKMVNLRVQGYPATFSTGNTGYRVSDKAQIGSSVYQVGGTITVLKPKK